METTTYPTGYLNCDTCEGTGERTVPVCYGGPDHAGYNCRGRACGYESAGPCEDCEGSGDRMCDHCGERAATQPEDPDDSRARWVVCDPCAEELAE